MHTWTVLAFLAAAASCIVSCTQRAWALALLAAGIALWLVPAAFQIR